MSNKPTPLPESPAPRSRAPNWLTTIGTAAIVFILVLTTGVALSSRYCG